MSSKDAVIAALDLALRTLSQSAHAARPMPVPAPAWAPAPVSSQAASGPPVVLPNGPTNAAMSSDERRLSGALMRVNHVGEVCAQALYAAQAMTARTPALRDQLQAAARDETDHLAWCEQRLRELGDRPSLLNPLWYSGAFAIGLVAGRAGDARSLGFLVETERQVEQHLASHLQRLPAADTASRAVVSQMMADEARHADLAERAGATRMPKPLAWAMRAAARLMTRTAHVI